VNQNADPRKKGPLLRSIETPTSDTSTKENGLALVDRPLLPRDELCLAEFQRVSPSRLSIAKRVPPVISNSTQKDTHRNGTFER
jgi:hypothetical protein